ncbi:MAG: ORF6N domain-containing protein, partial [Chlorobi bacterium]|nr:ORF6N domain-containing protein [Chlorobiota bacterium]
MVSSIQNRIFTFRGLQVMIDRDLAELYDVPTKRLNEQVKRNLNRFPDSFRFQLTDNEKNELVANCDRFEKLKHSTVNPYAFTEQGVAMLSAVLHSQTAVDVSIRIMEAFVEMRKFISNNAAIFQRLESVEMKQIVTDEKIDKIFKALENSSLKPKQGI